MPEGTEEHQLPNNEDLSKIQGVVSQESPKPENTEAGSFEQQKQILAENAGGTLGKIDALPQKDKLSDRARQKLEQIRDKYWNINARIATYTAGAGAATGFGIWGLGAYAMADEDASGAREILQGIATRTTQAELIAAGAGLTVYAASKMRQKFEEWRETRKIMKEAPKEAPTEAQK